jgi:hypothetical protein
MIAAMAQRSAGSAVASAKPSALSEKNKHFGICYLREKKSSKKIGYLRGQEKYILSLNLFCFAIKIPNSISY